MGNIRWAGEMGGFSDSVCSGEVACTGDALRIACSVCMMCWPQSCKQPQNTRLCQQTLVMVLAHDLCDPFPIFTCPRWAPNRAVQAPHSTDS